MARRVFRECHQQGQNKPALPEDLVEVLLPRTEMDAINATPAFHLNKKKKASRSSSTTTTRNPYAEFFDHAFDGDFAVDRNPNSAGCCCTQDEAESPTFPYLIGLNQIRMASLSILGPRLASIVQHQKMTRGWSGSIHLSTTELMPELTGREDECCDPIVIGGFVTKTSTRKGEVLALSDRTCQLCLRFLERSIALDSEDFVLGYLQTVVISWFCLLLPKSETMQPNQDLTINARALPPINNTQCNGVMGGGALVRLGDYIFVVSVQLICSQPFHFGTQKSLEL